MERKHEWSRRRGRPRKRWKEEVERELQVLGVRTRRELEAMEGYCWTGQSPQWAVVPMEEEGGGGEEEEVCVIQKYSFYSVQNSISNFHQTRQH